MSISVKLESSSVGVQRIFCIGRNYAAHAAELGNETPGEPVVFMKPSSAIVPAGGKIRLPRGRGEVHHEAELVLLIGRDGARAADDISGISLGLDLTLRDEQSRLKAKGLPWELAKAFEHSAPLGNFVAAPEDYSRITFDCFVNGEHRQHGDAKLLLFSVPVLLEFLSARFELRSGDLIFTGTPAGVGALAAGDTIELTAHEIGRFSWRCV